MKRHLGMIICLLMLGIPWAAQAQETPTPAPEQSTVDAAVQTLIAQTQGADTQIQMTGTIQAALQSALTATAQAQTQALTATPTPAPINWSNVALASTTEVALRAGPGRTAAYLAPDGEKFAHLDGDTLCIYEGETQGNCIDLEDQVRRMDEESLRWSPDSRYLTFTENFLLTFVDSDIWVWDTIENILIDVTDDGKDEIGITTDDWTGVDLAPDWLPDGRILFLRYSRSEGQFMPADIYTVTVDGQEEQLGTIQLSDPFNDPLSVYNLDVEGNQLAYIHASPREMPDDGVWISDLDGSNARHVLFTERERIPFAVDLSPDGRYALVITVPPNNLRYEAATSTVYLVDVEAGEMRLIDPDHYISGAGWTPEGSGLIYLTFQPLLEQRGGVYFTDTPGKAGKLLIDSQFTVPTGRQRQSLVWGVNDAVLLSRSPEQGIMLAQLEH